MMEPSLHPLLTSLFSSTSSTPASLSISATRSMNYSISLEMLSTPLIASFYTILTYESSSAE